MRRLLIIFPILLFLFSLPKLIYAVPSPQQVEEAQAKSQVVVTGEVKEVKINGSNGTFKLLVSDMEKTNGVVKIGDILVVDFRYISEDRIELGSSPVRVGNGDVIKIWLDRQENNHYISSLVGDTIEYIKINKTSHTIISLKEKISDPFFQIGFVFVVLVLGLTIYLLVKKFRKLRE